jgi:alpha-tubulin suppressor-like RCC1 family protein
VTTSGAAYCWGLGFFGRLGSNTTGSSVPITVAAPSGGNALNFSNVMAGFDHTCGVTTTGDAYCWGAGLTGQIGNNANNVTNAIPVVVAAIVP